MKAIIKIVNAERDFDQDQYRIIQRMLNVLQDHGLSVAMFVKVKKTKEITFKLRKVC